MTGSVVDCLDDVELAGPPASLDAGVVGRTVAAALAEDIGGGDITSETAVPECVRVEARAVAREPGVLAGIEVFEAVFRQVSPEVQTRLPFPDGRTFDAGETLAVVNGTARSILATEKGSLEFLAAYVRNSHSDRHVRRSGQGDRCGHTRYQENRARASDFRQVFGPRRRRRKPSHGSVRRARWSRTNHIGGGGIASPSRIARSAFGGRTRQIH